MEDFLPMRRGRGRPAAVKNPNKRQKLDEGDVIIEDDEQVDEDLDVTQEPLSLPRPQNGDEPEKIEGLIKRGKKLLAVVIWKVRIHNPELEQEGDMEGLEGDLSRELRLTQYGKGYRPNKSLMPFNKILQNHKNVTL